MTDFWTTITTYEDLPIYIKVLGDCKGLTFKCVAVLDDIFSAYLLIMKDSTVIYSIEHGMYNDMEELIDWVNRIKESLEVLLTVEWT